MKELAAYIGANSDVDGFCFCQFSGRRNPCSGADSYFVNVCGKVLSKRHANCQHNRLVLAQQAHNLQRHLSKVHSITNILEKHLPGNTRRGGGGRGARGNTRQ